MIGLAALAVSCGGSGSDDSTPATQTTITSSSARAAAADANAFLPVCSNTTLTTTSATSSNPGGSRLLNTTLALIQQRHQARLMGTPLASTASATSAVTGSKRALALTSTQPADVLGNCVGHGGRYGYTSYSHASGVTTATLAFSDYCTVDSTTGNEEVLSGSLSFVNTATPTDSGPISTKFTADTGSSGINALVRTTGGTTVSSETLAFTGLAYTVGVPGGNPTATNPDRMVVAEVKQTNVVSGKVRRQTGFTMTSFDTASGGSQMSYSARGYRSNGEYFDFSTTTPIVTDSTGKYTGGAITFTGSGSGGSGSSTAVLTVVPGATLQATLMVDGAVDSSLPACQ
ncbi:hypothetical protein [Sphaerotilus microaerophilus]|uniref:hypothetical protein n=1 Tax=Sphaerotilus microaerophilus TaxID=2914710 RepID=UPI0020738727|nr:hypothetical protein [Sphaerotilus sp. FB-5]